MSPFKKKIILDCDLMNHPHSGLYYYCLNLGMNVQELLAGNEHHESIAFYVPPAEANSFGPGAETIIEKKKWWDIFRRRPLDCTVWHAPFQSGRIVPDKTRYPNTRVLLTIHDLNPLHEGKSKEEQERSLAKTQSLIDRTDAIVCISRFCKEDVLQHCDTGNKPVYVIHNGTHYVHPPSLNGVSYKPQRPFLFGMGYVNRKKNFHVLLPLLKDEKIELLVAGRLDEPDYITSMKEMAEQMKVADRLHLLGPVSETEKAWYYSNCLAFVHPSLAEGFGAPVAEVMQFGKPIFVSALTSLPEIAGDAAFYFSNFEPDSMQRVLQEGLIRHESENRGDMIRQWGMQFDWKEKAKLYLEVYRSLY